MENFANVIVEPWRPFTKVGIDYLGPLYLKQGGKRSITKVWVALFMCMVSVGDLTSEYFINTLKRMMSRRRIVSDIYCDNATTFVGAQTEIKKNCKIN